MTVRTAGPGELDVPTLYALLRLRVSVFVVEQQSPYPELDGRDLEPSTVHCWCERDGDVVAALRVLAVDVGGSQIGRVVTAPHMRRRGLAGQLIREALRWAPRPVLLHSQVQLREWYERFGFAVTGPPFTYEDEGDSIVHVPMRLV